MAKKKKSGGAVIIVVLLILIVVAGLIGFKVYTNISNDINGKNQPQEEYTLTVSTKDYEYTIGKKLKDGGIVVSDSLWSNWMASNYKDFKYIPGEYKLTADMSYQAIAEKLKNPDISHEVVKVVIPEGTNCMEIASKLEKAEICSKADFLEACKKADGYEHEFLNDIPDNDLIAYQLEGFLFPATYDFQKNSGAKDIADIMLSAFGDRITDEMKAFCDKNDMTIYELITLSSVVQEEALGNKSAENIASVFMNRLAMPMRLQSDVTVFYARDLRDKYGFSQEVYDAYSTYNCKGLPAGPITNAGEEVINATINYPKTDYVFFFSDLQQEFHFAKDYQEFEELKAKYPWK
ncbi:MAG: endolytic transglycosylase MltG [Eubacterium sp.]|nr:endolytic transglycosylase MltG [Eubacterium sp.]